MPEILEGFKLLEFLNCAGPLYKTHVSILCPLLLTDTGKHHHKGLVLELVKSQLDKTLKNTVENTIALEEGGLDVRLGLLHLLFLFYFKKNILCPSGKKRETFWLVEVRACT